MNEVRSIIANPNGENFKLTPEQQLKRLTAGEFIAHLAAEHQMGETVVFEAVRSYVEKLSLLPPPETNKAFDAITYHATACEMHKKFEMRLK